eukprot:2680648-Pleurochrysis_carterae.AAC.2
MASSGPLVIDHARLHPDGTASTPAFRPDSYCAGTVVAPAEAHEARRPSSEQLLGPDFQVEALRPAADAGHSMHADDGGRHDKVARPGRHRNVPLLSNLHGLLSRA